MEERLAELEARIRELEAGQGLRRPMKETLRCPMCGARTIYRSSGEIRGMLNMYLGMTKGVFGQAVAFFQAHACSECGFAEFHADTTGYDVTQTDIEVLVGGDDGPYR